MPFTSKLFFTIHISENYWVNVEPLPSPSYSLYALEDADNCQRPFG